MTVRACLPSIRVEDLFQRAISAHLPPALFDKLRAATVLVAGLGGGSNIAELLARKGIGRLIIADPDHYEPHNIRQRGSLVSTVGSGKVHVMLDRLLDINPSINVTPVPEGITMENIRELTGLSDYIVEMLDFSALREKLALHRCARELGKIALTTPSVINGAVLCVFSPDGMSFEEFIGYREGMPPVELGKRLLRRIIRRFPREAPESLYMEAAHGRRTLPLDAVGVDQAAVLAVTAIENFILGRLDRVVVAPKILQVDLSDPSFIGGVVE